MDESIAIDILIDDLLRLQSRYPALIWRLQQGADIAIEFYLEELAIDCVNVLNRAGIPARHLASHPRLALLSKISSHRSSDTCLLSTLQTFLENHSIPLNQYPPTHKEHR